MGKQSTQDTSSQYCSSPPPTYAVNVVAVEGRSEEVEGRSGFEGRLISQTLFPHNDGERIMAPVNDASRILVQSIVVYEEMRLCPTSPGLFGIFSFLWLASGVSVDPMPSSRPLVCAYSLDIPVFTGLSFVGFAHSVNDRVVLTWS